MSKHLLKSSFGSFLLFHERKVYHKSLKTWLPRKTIQKEKHAYEQLRSEHSLNKTCYSNLIMLQMLLYYFCYQYVYRVTWQQMGVSHFKNFPFSNARTNCKFVLSCIVPLISSKEKKIRNKTKAITKQQHPQDVDNYCNWVMGTWNFILLLYFCVYYAWNYPT